MTRRSHARAGLAAALVGLIALAAAMAIAAPARATIYERFSFAFEDSVEQEECGIDARIDTVGSGIGFIRYVNDGLGQAFVGLGNIKVSETFTNLATGESFTIEARIREGDLTGEHVEGNVYEFTLTRAGIERVVDGDGDVVLRDSGVIRTTYLFDTLGDGQPGGEFLDELSVSVSGPHPLFEMEQEAFCAMVHELIG